MKWPVLRFPILGTGAASLTPDAVWPVSSGRLPHFVMGTNVTTYFPLHDLLSPSLVYFSRGSGQAIQLHQYSPTGITVPVFPYRSPHTGFPKYAAQGGLMAVP